MTCIYQYEYKGYRSFGSHIPPSCQGAYFPGDEPGIYCKLTQDRCQDPEDTEPRDCELRETIDTICPNCQDGTRLLVSGHGRIYCPECQYEE